MTKKQASFIWLFIPMIIYLALTTILYVERSGMTYDITAARSHYLGPDDVPLDSDYSEQPADTLVLIDSAYGEDVTIGSPVQEALSDMRVAYDTLDINSGEEIPLDRYRRVVITFQELDRMEQLLELVDWVERGGRVMLATRPQLTDNIYSIYRKLGIQSIDYSTVDVLGVAFQPDLLPGVKGRRLEGAIEEDFLASTSYPVQLEPSTRLHLTSADEYNLPLLWQYDFGKGRFVVMNTEVFANYINKGILGASFSLLDDVFIYPVINSSVFFIDDFPSPVPGGEHPVISEEFQRDIRSFFINIWWPDMQELADTYGLRYTGMLIETYQGILEPPFIQETSVDDHRYLGRLLLKEGGEVGLHGYNHVPLCLKEDGKNIQLEYPDWANTEFAQKSVEALNSFAQELFPGQKFTVYVPPSNILCPEARRWLPQLLPDLKMIASLLIEEEAEGVSYIQRYEEAADGIIEFPRVVSGYYLYEDMQLPLMNELGLHYVNSHFIHPDDILDIVRSEGKEWGVLRSEFDQHLQWLDASTPGMRKQTASEAGMATQRYVRLKVSAGMEGDQYAIHLGNFYDEAFLMLRTTREPASVTGGSFTPVTESLYLIQADQPDLLIEFKK